MREIIAEIGQNHNGDMVLAKELICAAKENGADMAKFQLFDTKALFLKEGNPWYEYNCSTELSKEQVLELSEECGRVGIEFGASVFDCERVDWLEEVGIARYKIASRSITDGDLINKLISLNKPLIVSLGMWEGQDFPAIKTKSSVDFLYCVAKYPADLEDLKLGQVDFNKYSGLSDHTITTTASMVALSRGAKIIEKHFTLDKNMHGPDHFCSMTPQELNQISIFKKELIKCL